MGQILDCLDVQGVINKYLLNVEYVINCRHICKCTFHKYFIKLIGSYNKKLLTIFTPIAYTCTNKTVPYHLFNLLSISVLKCVSKLVPTDIDIINSTQIVCLSCGPNNNLSNSTLFRLKNLVYLNCGLNTKFTDESISLLSKLKALNTGSSFLTDKSIIPLTNLQKIVIGKNAKLTDISLINKPLLVHIEIGKNCSFTDEVLGFLKLQKLYIKTDSLCSITDITISRLTTLEYLTIQNCIGVNVTPNCFKNLKNIKYLDCGNIDITNDILKHMKCLKYVKQTYKALDYKK